MTDHELMTLCAFQEADNQPDEGVAAIPKVVLNRTALRYASDGTISGTILRHAQFSWTEYSMVNRVYERVAANPAEQMARVEHLLAVDKAAVVQWARCSRIVAAVVAGSFQGPLFDKLTPRTVLYDNLALSSPAWASSSKLVVRIADHSFFEPAQSLASAAVMDTIAATKLAIGEA